MAMGLDVQGYIVGGDGGGVEEIVGDNEQERIGSSGNRPLYLPSSTSGVNVGDDNEERDYGVVGIVLSISSRRLVEFYASVFEI